MSLNHQIHGGSDEINGGDGGGGGEEGSGSKEKKTIGYGRKAKRVVLSRIKKAKKGLQRRKNKEKGNCVSGCCFCMYFRGTPSLDSSASESPTSDPNCSEFGFDSLKGLIEKSDFLLDECNTHLDVYTSDDHGDD